ncbi:MAG: hypothetical protein KAH06_09995 [Desulfobacterales bacterium]|nr:hypothetical protein [Desulfobacterales bacterium]
MGKKSLTKSTTKKKSAKKTEVKTTPKKKTAPKATAAPKKAPAKKKAAAKKPTLKSLLKKDFSSWVPENFLAVLPNEDYLNNFTAPPAIDTTDKAEADRIKALLAKTFDLSVTETLESAADAKAKAEKEAAEKAKAEAEAVEKAKAAKEAEEKAKADADAKAKAEKEAAEKTRAEAEAKAKAEKKAAEKAKAEAEAEEKAKAAKEAEEKAKADADAKAKAEKEAAEKAKAEAEAKAKAEKKAAEKAAATAKRETAKAPPPPAPPVMPTVAEPTDPPMDNALKMFIAIIGGIFGLLIIASAMNTNNYYLKSADNAVEIWQGKFSPTGKELLISMPDAAIKEPVKSVYTQNEALITAFNYFINNAEALSEVKGLLDFESIKSNLYKAIQFAPTSHHTKKAQTHLNKIDFMFLVYKADVAAGKNTIKGCEAALKDLSKAAAFASDKSQEKLLDKKTAGINDVLNSLKGKIKPTKPAAAIKKQAAEKITPKKSQPEKTSKEALQHEKDAEPETTKNH